HIETITKSILNNLKIIVKDIPLLTNHEKEILLKWNQKKNHLPNHTIHKLFEEQVIKCPNKIALIYDGNFLTYARLNQRANQVAHYLKKKGVCPESIIAVSIKRSLELIIAIFGVLKASCAYLPIDTEYPEERIIYMLKDSKTKILLTEEEFLE